MSELLGWVISIIGIIHHTGVTSKGRIIRRIRFINKDSGAIRIIRVVGVTYKGTRFIRVVRFVNKGIRVIRLSRVSRNTSGSVNVVQHSGQGMLPLL